MLEWNPMCNLLKNDERIKSMPGAAEWVSVAVQALGTITGVVSTAVYIASTFM